MPARAAEPMSATPSNAFAATSPARPVSNERLSVNDRGQVLYRLKHPFRTPAHRRCVPSGAELPASPSPTLS